MEASGRAPVPMYEPSRPMDAERRYLGPETGGKGERLALLWRERRFLWRVVWKTALLAAVVALLLPNHYESVTKIVPGESQSGAMGILGKLVAGSGGLSLGMDAGSLLGVKTPGSYYIEIMKSRTVQDRLINRFDLRRRYWKTGRWWPRDYYTTRKKLKSFTDFDEDKKSGLVTLSYTDYNPQMAAAIANAYVDELNRLASDLNTSDAHRERIFLEERLRSAKAELDQASLALSQFSSKNSVMDPQSQGKTMQDAAARVEGEVIAIETELKGLQQTYSDENVRVRTAKARIGELQSQLKKLMGSAGVTGADSPAGQLFPPIRALPMLGYQYADLYREARVQETVYEFLTQQYEMAKVQEAKELPIVRVLEEAVPAEHKSGPMRTLIVLLSVVAASALASFGTIGWNSWQQLAQDDPRRLLMEQITRDLRISKRKVKAAL